MDQQGQAVGEHAGCADAGNDPTGQHDGDVGCRGRHGSTGGEHGQPGQQHALAAEAVTGRAGRDHQAREQHDVGVDDPQELRR